MAIMGAVAVWYALRTGGRSEAEEPTVGEREELRP
jgi:hypothetical protein